MLSQYVISKCSNGWAIAVDGSVVLICERKKTAMQAVREATAHSLPLGAPDLRCHTEPQTEAHGYAKRAMAGAN